MSAATKHLFCKDTATLVRRALKAEWPAVKFSVRSHTYAGGASINVSWTDGPPAREVEAVTSLYTGGSFDGMTDMMSYHTSLLASPDGSVQEVYFGADFIFTHRTESPSFVLRCEQFVRPANTGSQPTQCRNCGNWLPAHKDCYVAPAWTDGPQRDPWLEIVCQPACGGKLTARTLSDSGIVHRSEV